MELRRQRATFIPDAMAVFRKVFIELEEYVFSQISSPSKDSQRSVIRSCLIPKIKFNLSYDLQEQFLQIFKLYENYTNVNNSY